MIHYLSVNGLVQAAVLQNCRISDLVLAQQAEQLEQTPEKVYETMAQSLSVMRQAVIDGTYPDLRSTSGLTGGAAFKMKCSVDDGKNICGKMFGSAMVKALAVSELNAAMGKIVAAPTAGSCGIIPAVLLTYEKQKNAEEDRMVEALYTAAGIGTVIAASASISGAEGGCQAEIGSASAMAAGAVTHLEGGTAEEIVHAAALALKNMLGLTCDPVAGLVEVPCIKRIVSGAVNAVISSQMAMAGIRSAIHPDEVIDSMRRIGRLLPECLRETSQEGLAITPTAQRVEKDLREKARIQPAD